MSVSGVVKSIQDIMRKDVGVDGDAQRISQLVWMLFLKIVDDREQEYELTHDNYSCPIPERYLWRNWAGNAEGITGDELLDFLNNDMFKNMKDLDVSLDTNPRGVVVKEVFKDAYNYMKSGHLIRQVVNKINEVDFNNSKDKQVFGQIYEQILKDLQNAGNAGEYYTPRAITKFIVNRVDPKIEDKVLDPACGTGGFLTCAIDYLQENYIKNVKDKKQLEVSINGVEKKPLPHLLCVTNMILHGIETPYNIKHDNTLSRPLIDYKSSDKVNVIITNPPFGGTEEDGIENNFPKTVRTRETADLFMVLIIKLLKAGGRAAVVLPDGFLLGEGTKSRIKEQLLNECNLHTIVRLPHGVFNPYTGIKTNILFFTKGKSTQDVWFYEHPYPQGVKNYSKTKPMKFEEFEDEIAWWGDEAKDFEGRTTTQYAWKVNIQEIKDNGFNLDFENPFKEEKINLDPVKLLCDFESIENKIESLSDKLKGALYSSLKFESENE